MTTHEGSNIRAGIWKRPVSNLHLFLEVSVVNGLEECLSRSLPYLEISSSAGMWAMLKFPGAFISGSQLSFPCCLLGFPVQFPPGIPGIACKHPFLPDLAPILTLLDPPRESNEFIQLLPGSFPFLEGDSSRVLAQDDVIHSTDFPTLHFVSDTGLEFRT